MCPTLSILSTEDRVPVLYRPTTRHEREERPDPGEPRGQVVLRDGSAQQLPRHQHPQQVYTYPPSPPTLPLFSCRTVGSFVLTIVHDDCIAVEITAGYRPVHFLRASSSASSTKRRWRVSNSILITVPFLPLSDLCDIIQ